MLKLDLGDSGNLKWRTDSLGKSLITGKKQVWSSKLKTVAHWQGIFTKSTYFMWPHHVALDSVAFKWSSVSAFTQLHCFFEKTNKQTNCLTWQHLGGGGCLALWLKVPHVCTEVCEEAVSPWVSGGKELRDENFHSQVRNQKALCPFRCKLLEMIPILCLCTMKTSVPLMFLCCS